MNPMNPLPVHTVTTRHRHRRTRWALSGLALVLTVSGCSGGSDGQGSAEPGDGATATAAPTAPTATGAAPTTSVPLTTVATNVDPATLLAQSLASTSVAYDFTTIVDVDGVEATEIGGRAIGNAVSATIESTAGVLEYVSSDDLRFVRAAGDDWSVLDEPVPGASTGPLAGLSAPISIGAVGTAAPNGTVLSATYPPSALGLADGQPLTVELTVTGGLLSAIEYVTTISGQVVTVHSIIAPATDATPITAPVLVESA
jgi:hypothetical protein